MVLLSLSFFHSPSFPLSPLLLLPLPSSIWIHYQALAMRIRRGSSTVESTLFPPLSFSDDTNTDIEGGTESNRGEVQAQAQGTNEDTLGIDSIVKTRPNPLSALPSADHALAYSVLSTGLIVVALATSDSELYVTYPGNVNPVDACTMADLLTRTLSGESSQLFHLGTN